jgi:hypothetical protein
VAVNGGNIEAFAGKLSSLLGNLTGESLDTAVELITNTDWTS